FKLLATPHSALFSQMMAQLGLLDILFGELASTHGVIQNRYHHLDVFEHSLQTWQFAETVINAPGAYFPQHADVVARYTLIGERSALLKCAGLLHDLGKPPTRRVDARGRVSFPGHAQRGAQLWEQAGRRLKLSVARIRLIRTMIDQHRRPFELLVLEAKGDLTDRVVHRLFREMGEDVLGLFVLTIADVLASRGPQTPANRAKVLGELCGRLWERYRTRILPVMVGPRLLTGDDLQSVFALPPGPRFKTILEEVELAQVEGRLRTREEALRWVQQQLATSGAGQFSASPDPQYHASDLMIDEDGELP
ncbi:MAG: HD domain-containing protein, partial [Candidatus Entotheonellia bacterium]